MKSQTISISKPQYKISPNQCVAYLDDGTMIVVENGHRHLNRKISVEVTSALQTAAGRMIFARPR